MTQTWQLLVDGAGRSGPFRRGVFVVDDQAAHARSELLEHLPVVVESREVALPGEQAPVVPGMVTAFGVFFMRQYLVDAVPDELPRTVFTSPEKPAG